MDLAIFSQKDFLSALRALFEYLQIPINYTADGPVSPREVLKNTWKDKPSFKLMKDVCFLGMVDDAAFSGNKGIDASEIKSDYDGILIFGVTLNKRKSHRLPTRSQLAEIARAFGREFFYTPVIVVYHYSGHLAFAKTERLKYRQEWQEEEKAGKVSFFRDIDITKPRSGHERILNDLKIPKTGKKKVDSFAELCAYWQDVFSAGILSKKFYQELSNWYFWAVREVRFPSEPAAADEQGEKADLAMLRQEHNAKNVIRLLTRFLFVWFVKEKKLIPEELFDIDYLKNELLKDLNPIGEGELSKAANHESTYYKAILQNLFFASLNCPITPLEKGDKRKRGFRLKDNSDRHGDANYLMRYKDQFKDPEKFLKLINGVVPFLNGALFECLDNKADKICVDGFSDNLASPHQLIVPDYLFFGFDQDIDLSNRGRGLISILESYKFTIAENTPIEEDVALDPELLGKVFENLLASYKPETRTSARKQTGSFYTPREIVSYMVDESLIAYLRTSLKNPNTEADELDRQLHDLLSYDHISPFAENEDLQKQIIHSLDNCKILDPACGSGAFPMGVLQKMVHILQKVDPENKFWRALQLNKAVKETEGVFAIRDKKERDQKSTEINDAFDEKINNPDYARKLFLIENCIYGVDIQPIAIQISKLRFFISLILDQKVDRDKPNFGIRALPNLETRFVAANTLIGIDKPEDQTRLSENQEIKVPEKELKDIRRRIFSVKFPYAKRRLRDRDKEIREKMGELLLRHGWANETARRLASWDPYDQNASSPFFDPEWMFDIKDGFDVVIGNPPYVQIQKFSGQRCQKDWEAQNYRTYARTGDIYALFYEKGNMLLKVGGVLAFITSNKWMLANYGRATRRYFLENVSIQQLIDFGDSAIFENATTYTNIIIFIKGRTISPVQAWDLSREYNSDRTLENMLQDNASCEGLFREDSFVIIPTEQAAIKKRIEEIGTPLREWNVSINYGIKTGFNEAFIITGRKKNELIMQDPKNAEIIKPILRGRDIKRYKAEFADFWLINSHNGYIDNDAMESVPPINIDDFPVIKDHLDNYSEKIGKRQDKGVTPYHLRNCAYLREFGKEKIVWPEMSPVSNFTLSNRLIFVLNTAYVMTGDSLRYLLALLNSSILSWYFPFISADAKGHTRRYVKQYVEILPIPKISRERQLPFEVLVDCILFAKEHEMEREADTFRSVIDGMAYDLCFEEEMKKACCHITGRIAEVVRPFRDDDTDAFKSEYVKKLYQFCNEDKTVFHGIIHRRNVKVVKIISGAGK